MCADCDKMNYVYILAVKDCTIITSHIYAPTTRIWVVKQMVIKNIDEVQLGVHGVILGQGHHQGVFLPQVATQTGWSKE